MARKSERGFVIVAVSLAAVFLLGMAGLAVDVGRMYVTRSEAQAFVDAAAIGAALQLDDTSDGVSRALSAVSSAPNRWQFANAQFTNVTTEFATTANGPWQANSALPSPPTEYLYAQVSTTVNLPLYLMAALVRSNFSTVSTKAVAARTNRTYFTEGIFPFSPYSHKIPPGCSACDDVHDLFGMRIGNKYTLRWAASPKLSNGNVCSGDASQAMIDVNNASSSSEHGYIELNNAADLQSAILSSVQTDLAISDTAMIPVNLTLDSTVNMSNGDKNSVINQAVAQRSGQDTDALATTYTQYKSNLTGNGRRVVLVPINNGAPDFYIAGFAGFFLLTSPSYDVTGNQPPCAEYIGSWTQGNPFSGQVPIEDTHDMKFMVRLIQ
jgi:Flp pilus assembly protein TadG